VSLQDAGVVAGTVSTTLFVLSYLPMLVKAARTRDLRSYSAGNLVVANIGNVVHSVYVLSLPAGPLWLLHAFYLVSSALMLLWWWRYHHATWPPSQLSREPVIHAVLRSVTRYLNTMLMAASWNRRPTGPRVLELLLRAPALTMRSTRPRRACS
jgi:uncharacterized protein with PQ loop repeat